MPHDLREIIARNIRECRHKAYPGRGGGKKCAEAFGVSPQQWSPWERGMRTPGEYRLQQIADFFGVSVEYMRRDNRPPAADCQTPSLAASPHPHGVAGKMLLDDLPSLLPSTPGSAESIFWLLYNFIEYVKTEGLPVRFDGRSLYHLRGQGPGSHS